MNHIVNERFLEGLCTLKLDVYKYGYSKMRLHIRLSNMILE